MCIIVTSFDEKIVEVEEDKKTQIKSWWDLEIVIKQERKNKRKGIEVIITFFQFFLKYKQKLNCNCKFYRYSSVIKLFSSSLTLWTRVTRRLGEILAQFFKMSKTIAKPNCKFENPKHLHQIIFETIKYVTQTLFLNWLLCKINCLSLK